MPFDPEQSILLDKDGNPAFDPEKATPVRSATGEIGTAAKRGLYEGAAQIGGALQTPAERLGLEPGIVSRAGQAIEKYGKEGVERNAPQPEAHNPVTNFASDAASGLTSFAPTLAAQAGVGAAVGSVAGPVGTVVGGALGAGGFTAGQVWHEEYQKALQGGLPPEAARDHADKSAALQGALMGGAGAVAGGVAKGAGIVSKAAGLGARDAAEAGTEAIGKKFGPEFAKGAAETTAVNTGASVGGAAGQAALDSGDKLNAESPGDAALHAIVPALGASVGFLPLAALGAHTNVSHAKMVANVLANPKADPEARAAGVRQIYDAMQKANPDQANTWALNAGEAIHAGQPIGVDTSWTEGLHPSVFPELAREEPKVNEDQQGTFEGEGGGQPPPAAGGPQLKLPAPGSEGRAPMPAGDGDFGPFEQSTAADQNAIARDAARAKYEAEQDQLRASGPLGAAAAAGRDSGAVDIKAAERQAEIPPVEQPDSKPTGDVGTDQSNLNVRSALGNQTPMSLSEAQQRISDINGSKESANNYSVVPHPSGEGYGIVPDHFITPKVKELYAGLQSRGELKPEPNMTPFDLERAQAHAEDLTSQSGVEHEVVPHPYARDKFLVQEKDAFTQREQPREVNDVAAEAPPAPEPPATGVAQDVARHGVTLPTVDPTSQAAQRDKYLGITKPEDARAVSAIVDKAVEAGHSPEMFRGAGIVKIQSNDPYGAPMSVHVTKGMIGIKESELAKPGPDQPHQLAHETSHLIDYNKKTGGMQSNEHAAFRIDTKADGSRTASGGIMKSALAAFRDKNSLTGRRLEYPLRDFDETDYKSLGYSSAHQMSQILENEVFAQLSRLYGENNTALKYEHPEAHALLKEMHDGAKKSAGIDGLGASLYRALQKRDQTGRVRLGDAGGNERPAEASAGNRPTDNGMARPHNVDDGRGSSDGSRERDRPALTGLPKSLPGPFTPARNAAADYMRSTGRPYNPPSTFVKVDPAAGKRVSDAYAEMKHDPTNAKVAAAYDAMIKETVAQWHSMMKTGLKVEFTDKDHPYPYKTPHDSLADIRDNHHLWVYSTDQGFGSDHKFDASDNPLLAKTGIKVDGKNLLANDVFRAVHDYFGHVKEGVGFRADGEENAWRAHAAMYSDIARKAMTSETRGQNSWLNWGPHGEKNRTAKTEDTVFADQKTGLLPDEFTQDTHGDGVANNPALEYARTGAKPLGTKGVKVEDVGNHFDDLVRKEFGAPLDMNDPRAVARASSMARQEFDHQIKQAKTGLDWYTDDIKTAHELTSKYIPELVHGSTAAGDVEVPAEVHRQAFSLVAGLLSPKTPAPKNWENAGRAYKMFTQTGRVPEVNPETNARWGPYVNPLGLAHFNSMHEEMGLENTVEWLLSPHTVAELNDMKKRYGIYKDAPVEGKRADIKMGAYIFGEKVGPFSLGLNGFNTEIAVDSWATRTANRYFGTVMKDGEIQDGPTSLVRATFKKIAMDVAKETGYDNNQVQAVLWFFEQHLYDQLGAGSPSKMFSDGARDLLDAEGISHDTNAKSGTGEAGNGAAGDATSERPRFTDYSPPKDKADVFYSALSRAIDEKGPFAKDGTATAQMLRNWLDARAKDGTIKRDELAWTGLDDYLRLKAEEPANVLNDDHTRGKVTRDEVNAFLDQHGVKVTETELGKPGKLPAGWSVREVTDTATPYSHEIIDENGDQRGIGDSPSDAISDAASGFINSKQALGRLYNKMTSAQERVYELQDAAEDNLHSTQAERNQAQRQLVRARQLFKEATDDYQTASDAAKEWMDDAPPTKYHDWQTPGGKDYRELLLTLPEKSNTLPAGYQVEVEREHAGLRYDVVNQHGDVMESGHTEAAAIANFLGQAGKNFTSGHFGEPNILAHIRFNERTDAAGKKVLFMEELQSDWAQKGRKQGFAKDATGWTAELSSYPNAMFTKWNVKDANGDLVSQMVGGTAEQAIARAAEGNGVPNAPFVGKTEAWVALAMKRVIRYAADNGFDRVAWTNGKQQAARYDMSKQVRSVYAVREGPGKDSWEIRAMDNQGGFHNLGMKSAAELPDVVGKELAQKIIDSGGGHFKDADLRVGGEGMNTFYDKIIPNVANDVLKKLGGGRVGDVDMGKEATSYEVVQTHSDGSTETWGTHPSRESADTQVARANEDGFENLKTVPVEGTEAPLYQNGFDITPAMKSKVLEGQPLFVRDDGSKVPDRELMPKVSGGKYEKAEQQFTKTGEPVRDETTVPKTFNEKDMPKWMHGLDEATKETLRKAGGFIEQKSIKEKLAEKKHEAGLRILQATVDQFASIQKKLGDVPYKLARMASSYDAAIETLLHFGQIKLNDFGAITRVQDTKGVMEILKPLKGEADRFMMWMAGLRADRLSKEDLEHNFHGADIETLKGLNGKLHDKDNMADGTDGAQRKMIYAGVLKEFMATQKSMLDLAEKAGTLDPELRKIYENQIYVPFYRTLEDGESNVQFGNVSGMVNQYFSKRLKGGAEPLGDLLQNTIQNWSHLVQSSLKNNAATKILIEAEKRGLALEATAGEKGAVYVLADGKQKWYTVQDHLLFDSISALERSPFKIPQSLAWFKHALTVGTTISPVFRLRHTIREQIASLILGHGSYNPVKNWVDGFKYSSRNNPEYGNMLAGGSFFRMGYSYEDNRAAYFKQLIAHGVDHNTVLDTPGKVKDAFAGAWDWWKETGERSDSITRANMYRNTYKEMIDAGKSPDEAHFEASYAARSVLDYGLHGTMPAIKMITGVVPFMNARMQGLYVIGKAAHADPARFAAVIGGVTLATMALSLAYRDDKEMQAREEWDRDNNWAFRLGGKMVRVPKPFELGAIATIADRALEVALNGFNPYDRERFIERIVPIIGSQLNLNPIASPAIATPIQLWGNKDWFSGRRIETEREQGLSPTERSGIHTSAAGIAGSKAIGAVLGALPISKAQANNATLSPEQIDFAVSALFGWVGTHALMTSDLALRPMMGMANKPALRVDELPVVGDFVKTLPENQSKETEAFYTHLTQVQQAMGDIRMAQKTGQMQKAVELMHENKDSMGLNNVFTRTSKQLGVLGQRERWINMRNMDPDEKRVELDRIAQMKNRLTAIAEQTRERAIDRRQ